jgi:hypothetical protein
MRSANLIGTFKKYVFSCLVVFFKSTSNCCKQVKIYPEQKYLKNYPVHSTPPDVAETAQEVVSDLLSGSVTGNLRVRL